LEAAARLVGNHAAVVRFAARGCGTPGTRPVSAPLSDPTAKPGEAYLDDVDAALRRVAHALLAGTDAAAAAAAQAAPSKRSAPAAAAAAYLRDRVGVPRDMRFPAARQLRAHLNWVIDAIA
jgi:glutathione S-transferase